ncbi:unnamed protein product, partial [Urochloa humidicola]
RASGAGGGDLVRGPARRGRAGWGRYDRWRAEPSSDQGELFVGAALGPSDRGGSGSGFPGSIDGPRRGGCGVGANAAPPPGLAANPAPPPGLAPNAAPPPDHGSGRAQVREQWAARAHCGGSAPPPSNLL